MGRLAGCRGDGAGPAGRKSTAHQWQFPGNPTRSPPCPDGARVDLWDTTATNRLRPNIVTLPDEAAHFQVSPTLENPTANPLITNSGSTPCRPGPADRVSPNLRIIMPTTAVTVYFSGDSRLPGPWAAAGWPSHNGVDWGRPGTASMVRLFSTASRRR